MKRLLNTILNISYLDSRSICLFQVCLGLTSLYRFINVLKWAPEFLSSDTFLPVSIVNNWNTKWSLFFISPTLTWAIFLCLIALLASVSLIWGYKPRLSLLILWILTLSLSNRIESIDNSGHKVFRLMLFWAMFLPSIHLKGIRGLLSLYTLNKASIIEKNINYDKVKGFGSFLLMSQFMIIYIFAGVTKSDSFWMRDYSALYMALHLGAFVKPFGEYIGSQIELTKILTAITPFFEGIIPFFILFDIPKFPLRSFAVLSLIFLPIGFFFFFELGIFPFSMITFALLFIPSSCWNYIFRAGKNIEVKTEVKDSFIKSRVTRFFVTIVALFALWDCLESSFIKSNSATTRTLKEVVYLTRTDQRWWMFVLPKWTDFWIDVKGTKASGNVVDLWSVFRGDVDTTFNTERPNNIREVFHDQHWNNYIFSLKDSVSYQEWFLYALCKYYNEKNPSDRMNEVALYVSSRDIITFENFSETKTELKKTWKCK